MHVCTFGSRWYLLRLCSTEDLEEQMARGGSLDPITEVGGLRWGWKVR